MGTTGSNRIRRSARVGAASAALACAAVGLVGSAANAEPNAGHDGLARAVIDAARPATAGTAERIEAMTYRKTGLSPREVRRIVVGNPYAKKLEVAQALAGRFPELRGRLPAAAPHRVLGYRPRDKYWLHLFDALAVALACKDASVDSGRSVRRDHHSH